MMREMLSDARYRLRALFRRDALERDLDDELRFHLERETEKYVAQGMSRAEAERRARLAFGGVERAKEESRDARGVALLDAARQDLRYALRGLRARPGFTAAVVLTLGLGLGANAAMFGIVDRLLFRPPPYLRDPATVSRVYLARVVDGTERASSDMAYRRFLDLTAWASAVSPTAAFFSTMRAVGVGDAAREMRIGAVSASFFDFFAARPALGRFFTAREDSLPAGTPVAVLSYPFWQARYGGRTDVLGAPLQIGPGTYTIIGVTPDGFAGMWVGNPPVAYVPITSFAALASPDPSDFYTTYDWTWMEMLVRRKPGVSERVASADLTTAYLRSYAIQRELRRGTPAAEIAKPRAIAGPLLRERGPNQGNESKVAAWVSGVAAIVLIIACANVANLFLARALRRRREIAVRLALGATRGRLISQLLAESLVLAVIGGVVGLLVAQWGGGVLRALFLPRSDAAVVADGRTLGFMLTAVLLTAILTGLAPALQAGRDDLVPTLKEGLREGSRSRARSRGALLVVQVALSVVLLVGAGLFVRSLHNVRSLRLGYDVEHVLYVYPNMRGLRMGDGALAGLKQRLLEEAKAVPGVVNAARQVTVPFYWTSSRELFVAGDDSARRLEVGEQAVSPEYFQTFGTRVVRGRGISSDDRRGAPRAVVVSEATAKALWPGKDALGRCVRIGADTAPCAFVVGVAEDIRTRTLSGGPELQYYVPIDQSRAGEGGLYVRTLGEAARVGEVVRRRLQRLMPGASYVTVRPMQEIIDPNTRSWRLGATMFAAFGALALVLAAIGLYAVVAYTVAQRTHELGVRIALGAGAPDVVRLVVGQGAALAAAGITIGATLALWAGRRIEPLLFGQSAQDPLVFGVAAAVLLCAAIAASAIPALRATRVDPNVALRAE